MKYKKSILFWSFASFFVNGMLGIMTGAILTYLIEDYGLSYSKAGLLVTAQSIGNLVLGLVSGFIIYKIGRRNSMLFFAASFAIGFGGIVFTDSLAILYILITLTGMGWGMCNNIIHILVTEVSEGKSTGITVLHTSYAVGAFVGPLVVSGVFVIGLNWQASVLILAALAILLFIVFLRLPLDTSLNEEKVSSQENEEDLFYFLKENRYYVCVLLYLTYIGVEASLNTWIITFLESEGIMSLTRAQFMLSLFWFIVIFARLFNNILSKYFKRDKLLTIQALSMLIVLSLVVFNRNEVFAMILILLLGLTIAGISPSNAANAREYISGAGIGSGIIFAGGSLGSAIMPFLIGRVAEDNGIFMGMILPVVLLGILFVLSLVNQRLLKKSR